MHGISAPDQAATRGMSLRLRRVIYDEMVTELGATTVAAQVKLTGVPERTLFRIRRGDPPSLNSAMRIADALGVPLPAIFERVEGGE